MVGDMAQGSPMLSVDDLSRQTSEEVDEVAARIVTTQLARPRDRDLESLTNASEDHNLQMQRALMVKVDEAGGLDTFLRGLQGIDVGSFEATCSVLRSIQGASGGKVELPAWDELLALIEEGGGLSAFTDGLPGAQYKNTAMARKASENKALLELAEINGGASSVKQLLAKMNLVGGVEKFLKDLGNLDIGYIPPILRSLRKLGCTLADLERLLQCTNQAGGMSKVLASLGEVDDLGRFTELLGNAVVLQKQLDSALPLDQSRCDPAAQGSILCKVLGDMSVETFLQEFAWVNLGALAGLVPLLISAGLLRQRGQRTGTVELGSTAEAFLRWVTRAGGVQRFSAALECVDDARLFPRCMDIIRSAGIGRMSEAGMRKINHWLERDVRPSGGLEFLVDVADGIDVFRACALPVRLEAGNDYEADTPVDIPAERLSAAQDTLEELADIATAAGGATQLAHVLSRLEIHFLEPMVDHLVDLGLHRPSATSCSDKIQESFAVWKNIASLASGLGGAASFYQKAVAVDLMHFDVCLEVLRAAGLCHPLHGNLEQRLLQPPEIEQLPPAEMTEWRDTIKVIAASGGPTFFLESVRGSDFQSFLEMASMLRKAGLAFEEGSTKEEREASKAFLQEFVKKVCEAGGLNTFWYTLKNVDLSRLRDDLYCLGVIRRRLSSNATCPEDMWHIATDPDRLDALLNSVGGQRPREEDLTASQRERLMRKFRNIGGVENFLEAYETIDLKSAADELRALKNGGVSSPQVISELARFGQMVQHDLSHLRGLGEVVGTLVTWIQNRDDSDAPSLWHTLNEQVVWLLRAITENGAMVHAVVSSKRGVSEKSTPKAARRRQLFGSTVRAVSSKYAAPDTPTEQAARQEPDLTPARLAQFLQALRPLGGVRGFLTAYRGLDLPTAAAQARVLFNASVRTVETAQRLANVFRLLHYDTAQLRGLELFVQNFGATVMVETHGDKLRTSERWEVLSNCLTFAASGVVASPDLGLSLASGLNDTNQSEQDTVKFSGDVTFSGADHVRDVLALGVQLSSAAGLDALPEEWAALCGEIKARRGGLGDVLTDLRGTQGAKAAPAQVQRQAAKYPTRQRVLACSRCGTRMPQYHRVLPRACSLGSLRSVGAAGGDSAQQASSREWTSPTLDESISHA